MKNKTLLICLLIFNASLSMENESKSATVYNTLISKHPEFIGLLQSLKIPKEDIINVIGLGASIIIIYYRAKDEDESKVFYRNDKIGIYKQISLGVESNQSLGIDPK